MARIARVVIPGEWHHVTQRGNHRQTVFFNDADRRLYLQLLRRHCTKHAVTITGYCLMSNHVHLLAVPAVECSLARALGRAHNDYARWLNLRRGQTGHFWQNRFFSCPLNEDHRWEALRYVELNPVRAGLSTDAQDWPWSSAAAHLGGSDNAALLSLEDWRRRWSPQVWHDVLAEGLADAAMLERLREATRTGRSAGSDAFMTAAEQYAGRRLRSQKPGPKARAADSREQLQLAIA
jgi:putative transposase